MKARGGGAVMVFVVMDTPYMVYHVRKGCIILISLNWVYPGVGIKLIHPIWYISDAAVPIRSVFAMHPSPVVVNLGIFGFIIKDQYKSICLSITFTKFCKL